MVMADFEERLRELEETLNDTESALQQEKAPMPSDDLKDTTNSSRSPYLYAIGALIPIIVATALYFSKPGFVTKQEKGKKVVCLKKLFLWTAVITAVGYGGLFLFNYYRTNNAEQ